VKKLFICLALLAGLPLFGEPARRIYAPGTVSALHSERKTTLWSMITGSAAYATQMVWQNVQLATRYARVDRLYFRAGLVSTAGSGVVMFSFYMKSLAKMSPDQRLELQRNIEFLER
jgi:hypothetical protein